MWGASRIAEAVAKYDVDRFIHVSSHSVSSTSPSEFLRTKALGESVVRDIYPETTIVRPAPMYGYEDRLLNKLAAPSGFMTSNTSLSQTSWPVHVVDVAAALETMMHDDEATTGHTFELFGPKKYTVGELHELVSREVVRKGKPGIVAAPVRRAVLDTLNRFLWWNTGCGDDVERENISQTIDMQAKTFADLGIEPVELESMTYQYLVSSRCV